MTGALNDTGEIHRWNPELDPWNPEREQRLPNQSGTGICRPT